MSLAQSSSQNSSFSKSSGHRRRTESSIDFSIRKQSSAFWAHLRALEQGRTTRQPSACSWDTPTNRSHSGCHVPHGNDHPHRSASVTWNYILPSVATIILILKQDSEKCYPCLYSSHPRASCSASESQAMPDGQADAPHEELGGGWGGNSLSCSRTN